MYEPIRIAGIVNDSITDGPGLRLTFFMQGCPRRCEGCHNPAALPMEGGRFYCAEELFSLTRKNPLLDGVTFSGGEPFLQASALLPLAESIRRAGLSLAVYTGFLFEEILRENREDALGLLRLTNTLVDGPFVLKERDLTLPFRGSRNQRILCAARSLDARVAVWEEDAAWNPALD